jgi:hypothetical protein
MDSGLLVRLRPSPHDVAQRERVGLDYVGCLDCGRKLPYSKQRSENHLSHIFVIHVWSSAAISHVPNDIYCCGGLHAGVHHECPFALVLNRTVRMHGANVLIANSAGGSVSNAFDAARLMSDQYVT